MKEDGPSAVGAATRLVMLQTHYRKPLNWTNDRLELALGTLNRWCAKMEICDDAPPEDVLDALKNDLNTPLAITHMHAYAKAGEGRKLYAAMKFLGLIA